MPGILECLEYFFLALFSQKRKLMSDFHSVTILRNLSFSFFFIRTTSKRTASVPLPLPDTDLSRLNAR